MFNPTLTSHKLLLAATLCSAAFAVYLIVRPSWRRVRLSVIGFVGGCLLGLLIFWLVVNVFDVFGVTLSDYTRLWVVLGFGGLGLAIVNLFRSRWWRKVIAIIAIPGFLATAALHVNADFGAFNKLADVFGDSAVGPLKHTTGERGEVISGMADYRGWKPPKDLPAHGVRGTVEIPGKKSGFPARRAMVWLPPAAFAKDPPALPVIIAMSGQPGGPYASYNSGHMDLALDKYQAEHHGIAPILVAADQLSNGEINTMCIDSKAFGNSATYMTEDVPNWIRQNYRVSSDPKMWGLVGFSQGGTCVSQFMSAHPDKFGSGIATLSQLGPVLDTVESSIAKGFNGSKAAYEAAQPIAIMRAHGPYTDTMLTFGSGEKDQRYTKYARQLNAAAKEAGMHSELILEPTGHDWHTVQAVFEHAFPQMAARMGIDKT